MYAPRVDATFAIRESTNGLAEKLADIASPILLQTCAVGKMIPQGCLQVYPADDGGCRFHNNKDQASAKRSMQRSTG